MPQRKFTLLELSKILPDYDWNCQQIDSAHTFVYFECDGKTWRIETKTNTDDENEIQQALDACKRENKYWECTEIADEVRQEQVVVTKYVLVR